MGDWETKRLIIHHHHVVIVIMIIIHNNHNLELSRLGKSLLSFIDQFFDISIRMTIKITDCIHVRCPRDEALSIPPQMSNLT